MAEMLWLAAGLLLMLPPDMKPEAITNEQVPVLGLHPPVLGHVDQLFCSWLDNKDARVSLFWWNGSDPPRPLGPISTIETWELSVGSRRVSAARTNLFMGYKQEVLVAWPSLEGHQASAMLYAKGLSRESFDRMLKESHIVDTGRTWSMTCEPMQRKSE
jgi:hypothetical protein